MYDIEKILSKETYDILSKSLNVCRVCQVSRYESAYNDLRSELAELFSVKAVSLYPKDVLVDLAETIQDLYIEQNNLEEYMHHTEQYLLMQLKNYRKLRKKYNHKMNWEKSKRDDNLMVSLEKIDLIYLANSYSNGYHKNKASMYRLLLSLIRQMKEEGIK